MKTAHEAIAAMRAEIEQLDEKYRTLRVNGTIQQAKEADLVVHVLLGLSNFLDTLEADGKKPKPGICPRCAYYKHEMCYYPNGGLQTLHNENGIYECTGFDQLEAEEKPAGWGEEDKIKAKMLKHFKSKTKKTWCNIPVSDIIAWLEKETPTIEETELNSIAFLEQLGYSCVPPSSQSVKRKAKEKEVDLKKEIDDAFFHNLPGTERLTHKELVQVARHFYELGLNARKK